MKGINKRLLIDPARDFGRLTDAGLLWLVEDRFATASEALPNSLEMQATFFEIYIDQLFRICEKADPEKFSIKKDLILRRAKELGYTGQRSKEWMTFLDTTLKNLQ